MRTLLITAILVATPAAAVHAMPLAPVDAPGAVVEVQNRFIPGFLRGEDNKNQDNTALRIDQLEAQVRMLTGQVEQLTFTVRRLEQIIAGGQTPGQQGALPAGPGAPPRSLGTLPAQPGTPGTSQGNLGNLPAQPAPGTPSTAANNPPAAPSGPIDLSVLNQGVPQATAPATAPTAPAPAVTNPAPAPAAVDSPALANVRQLQQSGRYALAAQEARALLEGNPSSDIAGEARFLLGEALLAQGDYRGAAKEFLDNYTSHPNSARAPESLLRLGTSLNSLGEREAACSSLEELFGAYPNVSPQVRAAAERERQAANCA
ncbi:MAG: tetratricopeptide repeat protein [Pseudomonadota bacterium]